MPEYKITKPLDPYRSRGAPKWVIDACTRVRDRDDKPGAAAIVKDDPDTVAQGLMYVLKEPEVSEGGRNDKINRIANRLFKDGLSPSNVLLLTQQFNELKCSPPLDDDEVERTVASACSRKGQQGVNTPEADFKPLSDSQVTATDDLDEMFATEEEKRGPFVIAPAEFPTQSEIPARRWLLGHHLLVNKVSVTIAPPGAGKSTYALAQAVSVITGKKELTGLKVHETGNALIINNEDDQDELDRRMAAVLQHFGVPTGAIAGRLYTYSGVHRPFIMAKRNIQGGVKAVDKADLIEQIRSNDIRLVIVDPFLETHEVDENNNEEINKVARFYREVAVEADCAVHIIHHTRKQPAGSSEGHAGNMESGRGASSLSGVARIMHTLYSMSEKDAKQYGISNRERHLFVRLDDAKANLSLATHNARWFKKVSVRLSNGDEVGVLEPIELQLAVEAEKDAWLAAIIPSLEMFSGEITVRQAAEAILDDPILGVGLSLDTIQRRLKTMLENKQLAEGWEMWYEHDETRKGGTNRAVHWVYGRVIMDFSPVDGDDDA